MRESSHNVPQSRRSEISTSVVVTHQIAGIVFRTESNSWLPRLQEDPFERFRVGDDAVPDVYHRIHKVEPHSQRLPPPTREEWEHLPPTEHHLLKELKSPLLRSPVVRTRLWASLKRPEQVTISLLRDLLIIRDFARRELDLFYTPEFDEHAAEVRVASDFRMIFSTFLPCFSAVLIHSAGLIRSGKAAVFVAPDEGGKTTLVVELSTSVPILHDDQIVFRKEGNVVKAYATPLGMYTNGPCSASVGGLFWLEKAPRFELTLLNASDLIQPLWGGHKRYTGSLPKDLKRRAFEVICDACFQAPTYRLQFPRDYVDWGAIDAAMTR